MKPSVPVLTLIVTTIVGLSAMMADFHSVFGSKDSSGKSSALPGDISVAGNESSVEVKSSVVQGASNTTNNNFHGDVTFVAPSLLGGDMGNKIKGYDSIDIKGKVLDINGKPIVGVSVEIPSYGVRSDPTDYMGFFYIKKDVITSSRDSEVRVKHDGYHVNNETIDLKDNSLTLVLYRQR